MTPSRVTLVSGLGTLRLFFPGEPFEYAPPLGVLALAAGLRGSLPVCLVDLDDLWRLSGRHRQNFQAAVVESICSTQPDILGFSTISGSYPLTIRLAEICARRLPEATIVFGGPQASVTDVATMTAFPFVDLILRGEADVSFPALVAAINADSTIAATTGLTFRERSQIRRNPNGPVVLDMDLLPLPAYDLVPCARELSTLPLEIGRGCPYTCTFCSTNDFFRRRFRLKSPEHVLNEMHQLHDVWGITVFDLVHDMFTVDRRKVVEFCETMITAGCPYKWSCSARTDSVDTDLLRLMKQAGCNSMFFGIETGSPRMQRIIDKDLDLGAARTVFEITNSLDMHSDASLIVGYPQETADDLRQTVNFYAEVMLLPWVDPQINILSPLAATPITEEYRDRLVLDENWVHISENGTLQDAVDRLMIASHPDIFTNFYAFPFYTDRDVLRRLRDFLFYGKVRCGGLMRALYLHTRDMLAVFDQWDKSSSNPSLAWFSSLEFARHLISFCEANYPSSPTIAAMARFYKSVFGKSARRSDGVRRPEPWLTLAENVVVVDCECDINAVLEALSAGREPDHSALHRPVTVAVRLTEINRSEIARFPPTALDLLRHAEAGSPLAEIERDFEERNVSLSGLAPWKVARGGIDYLEGKKLVRRVFPDAAASGDRPPLQTIPEAFPQQPALQCR